MNTEIQKPITLLREDFIENIQNLCNSSGLPYFVISDILKWLIPQVDEVARREIEKDKAIFEAKTEAEKKEEKS